MYSYVKRMPKKTKQIMADSVSRHDNKHISLLRPFMLRFLTDCYDCYYSVSSFILMCIKQRHEGKKVYPYLYKPCS